MKCAGEVGRVAYELLRPWSLRPTIWTFDVLIDESRTRGQIVKNTLKQHKVSIHLKITRNPSILLTENVLPQDSLN